MKVSKIPLELRVSLLYLLFSFFWIVLSDRLLASMIDDPVMLTSYQTYKGWFFIAVSAVLIYSLLRRDLAQQRQLDAALRENEERYRQLFNTSLDAILLSAPDGRIFAANPAACRIFGRSEAEICQLGRDGLVDADSQEWAQVLRERSKNGHSVGELTFLRKDGSTFSGEISTAQYKDTHTRDRTSLIIRDITERKRAEKALRENEEQLRKLNAELEQRVDQRTAELHTAMEKAQQADRLKSAFLATMSHELRTPLNSIIGFTGVLMQGLAGPVNPEQTKQLGMVRQSSQHLLSLINDVLDLSKIEAGQLEINKAFFDLRLVIESVLKLATPMAQKKGLELQCVFGPSIGLVWSDKRRVEQVLHNLVSNAIKFTDHGEVNIECHAEADWIHIRVHDTGIGIRREDLHLLFEPFNQLDTGLNRKHEGTGLGLSICKNLVHLLGGEISVESEWQKGSCFSFTLPHQAE